MLPSTTLNTHVIIFPDSEGRENLPITSKKAEAILSFLSSPDKQSHFHLLDSNGNFKEALPRSILSRSKVQEIQKNEDVGKMKWNCYLCGRWNFMHVWPPDECECRGNKTEWIKEKLNDILLNN